MVLLADTWRMFINVGVIAIIIVFQPEIRRFLQMIGLRSNRGRKSVFRRIFEGDESADGLAPVAQACVEMSQTHTGALVVLQMKSDLTLITEGGIAIDAEISVPLLKNLFFKNSPLHDGAVVLFNGRVVAARCILPTTQSVVPKSYGTRHRAAIGMSEVSDAVIVVVSEETGAISIACKGVMERDIEHTKLLSILKNYLSPEEE